MGQGRAVSGRRFAPLTEPPFSPDDPAVRFGEALFETMRSEDGRVVSLSRHLERLLRSAQILRWSGVPGEAQLRAALRSALDDAAQRSLRIRLTASAGGRIAVETSPIPDAPAPEAVSIIGAWHRRRAIAEHKTTSYAANRLAHAHAVSLGAGHALLLDSRGHLGETAFANVICALDDVAVTPPARGLLPGVARQIALEAGVVAERELPPEAWGRASEIVAINALRGPMPIHRVDGRAVGESAPEELTALVSDLLVREQAEAP